MSDEEQVYHANGIVFRCPPEWMINEERHGDEFTVSATSPDTAFWMITLLPDREPRHVLEEAVSAFREEYDELDVSWSEGKLSRRPAQICEVEFVCLELISTARMYAFSTGQRTALVMSQVTDHEEQTYLPTFDHINQTLECDVDREIL